MVHLGREERIAAVEVSGTAHGPDTEQLNQRSIQLRLCDADRVAERHLLSPEIIGAPGDAIEEVVKGDVPILPILPSTEK
jgi:hypothetical protein